MTNVSIDEINDMKYPMRNNHDSSLDFIHFEIEAMIRRGNARITNITGAVKRFLCN